MNAALLLGFSGVVDYSVLSKSTGSPAFNDQPLIIGLRRLHKIHNDCSSADVCVSDGTLKAGPLATIVLLILTASLHHIYM